MLNHVFNRVVCINLDKRLDRWEESSSLFSSFGFEVERVSAIEDFDTPWDGLRKTTIGIFEKAISDNIDSILIFEDDIAWGEDFSKKFQENFDALPEDWDMFYFSAAHQYWPPEINSKLFKLKWSTAAHAIGFRKKCFNTILSELKTNKQAIDVIYSKLQNVLNAYCCIEPIAWQRRGYSDIEGKEKWYPYLKDINFYQEYSNKKVTVDGRDIQTGEQRF